MTQFNTTNEAKRAQDKSKKRGDFAVSPINPTESIMKRGLLSSSGAMDKIHKKIAKVVRSTNKEKKDKGKRGSSYFIKKP